MQTIMLPITFKIIPKSLPRYILLLKLCITMFPNGILSINPILTLTIEINVYFAMYNFLIGVSLKPIAFITPISLNSSLIVNEIENLKMKNEITIKHILNIKKIKIANMSTAYIPFN